MDTCSRAAEDRLMNWQTPRGSGVPAWTRSGSHASEVRSQLNELKQLTRYDSTGSTIARTKSNNQVFCNVFF